MKPIVDWMTSFLWSATNNCSLKLLFENWSRWMNWIEWRIEWRCFYDQQLIIALYNSCFKFEANSERTKSLFGLSNQSLLFLNFSFKTKVNSALNDVIFMINNQSLLFKTPVLKLKSTVNWMVDCNFAFVKLSLVQQEVSKWRHYHAQRRIIAQESDVISLRLLFKAINLKKILILMFF